jgi:hypothetical protein
MRCGYLPARRERLAMTERMAERDDAFRNGERAESGGHALSAVLPAEWERPVQKMRDAGEGEPGKGSSDTVADQDLRGSNTEKDPDEWTTGDEPMTGAQASYLKTLSDEAKEPFDDSLTKAEASKRIDALQEKTGRGKD